jgi:glycosyltransferase involved in cell wall biosynthesis
VIYICIPALNEAPTVGVLLWRIRQVMTEFRRDFHLIVLDDGSSDATSEVLAPYARVLPLTLLRNDRSQGYAAALERVLREAVARSTHPKRDTVVVMQADFTEPPEEIPALVKKLEGGADVVGSTMATVQGEVTRGMRWSRRGLPWLLSRAALPAEVGDPFLGFRAYRVQVIKRALADREGAPLLTRQGWAANAELLLRVAPHARRADQAAVEIRYTRRDRDTRFDAWAALRETWELAKRAPRRGKALAKAPDVLPPPQGQAQAPGAAADPSDEGRPPRRRRKRGNREGNIPDRTEGPDGAGD